MSGTGLDVVTPELALVDPKLAGALRQIRERKAAMSTTPDSNGAFFLDEAGQQPAPAAVTPEPAAAPPPPEPVPTPVPPVPTPVPQLPAPPAAAEALPADPSSSSMVDVPLGTLIFRAGLLAEEQLEDALQEGMRTGKRLGEVLLERGWLHERDLGRLLAGQKGLPFVHVTATDPEPAALQVLPEEKARLQNALPLRFEDGRLVIAVADPSNELVLENLRRTLGTEPQLVVAAQGELLRAINEAYAAAPPTALVAPEVPVVAPPVAPEQQAVPSLQPEPAASAPAPEVAPMPTVLPPTEERPAQPVEVAPLQAPLPEPAVQVQAAEEPAPLTPPAPVLPEPVSAAELDALLASNEPILLAAIGGGGLVVILFLMILKPF